jgi:hypothetical protein
VPEELWGKTLRAIDREVNEWAAQRSAEQTAWLLRNRRESYRGTLAAADEIVARSRPTSGD